MQPSSVAGSRTAGWCLGLPWPPSVPARPARLRLGGNPERAADCARPREEDEPSEGRGMGYLKPAPSWRGDVAATRGERRGKPQCSLWVCQNGTLAGRGGSFPGGAWGSARMCGVAERFWGAIWAFQVQVGIWRGRPGAGWGAGGCLRGRKRERARPQASGRIWPKTEKKRNGLRIRGKRLQWGGLRGIDPQKSRAAGQDR